MCRMFWTFILHSVTIITARQLTPATPFNPTLTEGFNENKKPLFLCEFRSSSEEDVEYLVCLNIDGRCFSRATLPGTSFSQAFLVEDIDQPMFRKKITCSIQARWTGNDTTTGSRVSNVIFPDIQLVTDRTMTIAEGDPETFIMVNITAPLQAYCCTGCRGNCSITVSTSANQKPFYEGCSSTRSIAEVLVGWSGISQSESQDTCGVKVPLSTSSWQQVIQLPIKAYIDGRLDDDSVNIFRLEAKIQNFPGVIMNYQETLHIDTIEITVRDRDLNTGICKSENDPHMTSFDGRRYENHNAGEFIMYKHTSLPYEVRVKFVQCSPGIQAFCNCGAAVRSGDDVITLSSCESRGLRIKMFLNGDLTEGTKVLIISSTKYKVVLPTGTVVTVDYDNWSNFINIFILASTVDRERTEGLCGLYDGNSGNDIFNPSTGLPDNIGDRGHPTQFNLYWRRSETIFLGVPADPFDHINTFCSCVNGKDVYCDRGHGVMSCSKSPYDKTDEIVQRAQPPSATISLTTNQKERTGDYRLINEMTENTMVYKSVNSSFTYDEAVQNCRSTIESNEAVKSCLSVINMTESELNTTIENCAFDLQITGDVEWASGHITGIVEDCLNTLAALVKIENNGVVEPESNVTSPCVSLYQNCSQNGECVEGVCSCFSGFSGATCNITASSTVPTVNSNIAGTCGCDVRSAEKCEVIAVSGSDFVNSPDLTCHYEYSQAPNFDRPSSLGRSVAADYISDYEVSCILTDTMDGVYVSVSNNGLVYSTTWYLHTVYDSVCFLCSLTEMASQPVKHVRQNNSCIINGICLRSGETKPGNSCKNCDPSLSTTSWTQNTNATCLTRNPPVDETGYKTTIDTLTVFLVLFILATVILALTLIFVMQSKKRSYTPVNSNADNTNISLDSRPIRTAQETNLETENEIRTTEEKKHGHETTSPMVKPARKKLNSERSLGGSSQESVSNQGQGTTTEKNHGTTSSQDQHQPTLHTDERDSHGYRKAVKKNAENLSEKTSNETKPDELSIKMDEREDVKSKYEQNNDKDKVNNQLINELRTKHAETKTSQDQSQKTQKIEDATVDEIQTRQNSVDMPSESLTSIVEDAIDKKLIQLKQESAARHTSVKTKENRTEEDKEDENSIPEVLPVAEKIDLFNYYVKEKHSSSLKVPQSPETHEAVSTTKSGEAIKAPSMILTEIQPEENTIGVYENLGLETKAKTQYEEQIRDAIARGNQESTLNANNASETTEQSSEKIRETGNDVDDNKKEMKNNDNMDGNSKETSDEAGGNSKERSDAEDGNSKGTNVAEDGNSKETSVAEDGNSKVTSVAEDGNSKETSDEAGSNSKDTSDAVDGNSKGTSVAEDGNSKETSDAEGGNSKETSDAEDYNSKETSNAGDDNSKGTSVAEGGNSKETSVAEGGNSKETSDAGDDNSKETRDAGDDNSKETSDAGDDNSKGTSDAGDDNSKGTSVAEDDNRRETSDAGDDNSKGTSDSGDDNSKGTSDAGDDNSKGTSVAEAITRETREIGDGNSMELPMKILRQKHQ